MIIKSLKPLKPCRQPESILLIELNSSKNELIRSVVDKFGALIAFCAIKGAVKNNKVLKITPNIIDIIIVILSILFTLCLSVDKNSGMYFVAVKLIPDPTKIINKFKVDLIIPTSPLPSLPKILATINQATNNKPLDITEPIKDNKELLINSLISFDRGNFLNSNTKGKFGDNNSQLI